MKRIISVFKSELGRIIIGLSLFVAAFICDAVSRPQPTHHLHTVALVIYLFALAVAGIPVFVAAIRGILRGDLLDEKFLMSVASVGAIIIGETSEGVAVMLFFLVGEYFEHRAVAHSRKSIRALMSIRPDEATVLIDGVERVLDAEDVEIGSTIIIRAGERVPIDSTVILGSADVDTSALTGESMPRAVSVGARIESGSVVMNGVITCRTERTADESAAARILELVENASENKSKEESFITRFSRFYTPIVVGLAVLMALIPPICRLMSWSDAVYSALNFLVISCPCALVISVPMAFFGGIGGAASRGILFKGGNVFSPLAKADSFAFDKTGTLTTASFKVSRVIAAGNMDEDTLVFLAASAEYGSNHPLSECIKSYAKSSVIPTEYREIAGRGVVAMVEGKTVLVGNSALLCESGILVSEDDKSAALIVAVDGEYVGKIIVEDATKKEAESAIASLKKLGARRIAMLSGDRRDNAERVGRELGISEIHAELLPQEKYEKLAQIIEASTATVYVGDGINDAPAIVSADVGIAMGAMGSDSAIEAADVVIMSDSLDRIPTAVKIARKTVGIAKMNIVFALAVKGAILALSAFGFANMWLAVFADVGVAVIAILNAIRTMKVGKSD